MLPRLIRKQKVNISPTFGSRTSRTSRQTGRPIRSSTSWEAGLALRPREARGACRGDKMLLSDCVFLYLSVTHCLSLSPIIPGRPPSPGPPFAPGKPGLPGKPLSPGAPSLARPPEERQGDVLKCIKSIHCSPTRSKKLA